ncbi:hypothetical protein [Nocardioides sp.]|uniref:hypothetical protein n=1 Tax=Nocardioides sp. TaxID=35761 RepID=UPI00356ABF0F
MRVPFEEVPLDVRRRAARAVATLVGDKLSPTRLRKAEPRFGEATPVYRPDLRDIAYWEIEIAGLSTALPRPEGDTGRAEQGFILVSTGAHDVPVPHFSLDLAPPSRQLDELGSIHRVLKLDALCYAGVDRRGKLIGHIGSMPPKLAGVPRSLPRQLPAGHATSVATAERGTEDGEKAEGQRIKRSREKRPIKLTEWRSWEELTKGYADTYRLHLSALAERAARQWETEELTDTYGEGIHSGTTHTVWLLEEGEFSLEGAGAELVRAELIAEPLPPKLVLKPRADVSVEDTNVEVHLRYANGEEVLRYFIVPDQAPSTAGASLGPLGEEL